MIAPERLTDLDAVLARSVETVPALLHAFYQASKAKGFNNDQAMLLTKTFLQAILAVPAHGEFSEQPIQE